MMQTLLKTAKNVTTIVSKIDAKAVILQESCLLMLAEII